MTEEPSPDVRVELKYVIDEPQVQAIHQWARQRLGVDPHCSPELVDSYDVHTLYLDTPQLDVYHRSGTAGATKHRIRRYGNDGTLWLECKRKKQNVVRKNRIAVPECEVWNRIVVGTASAGQAWCGDWFVERIARRQLEPALEVHYRRFARMARCEAGSVRLTIDSQLQTNQVNGWQGAPLLNRSLPTDRRNLAPVHILELKFNNHMPHSFKELLTEFPLALSGFSKYRAAISTCGLNAAPDSSVACDEGAGSTSSAGQWSTDLGAAANA